MKNPPYYPYYGPTAAERAAMRLADAAPDLLAALIKCAETMEREYMERIDPLNLDLPDGLKEARAAIAKATAK